jgi:hypothetical protein
MFTGIESSFCLFIVEGVWGAQVNHFNFRIIYCFSEAGVPFLNPQFSGNFFALVFIDAGYAMNWNTQPAQGLNMRFPMKLNRLLPLLDNSYHLQGLYYY